MLTPNARTVVAALHDYRSAWAGLLRDPASPAGHRRFDDAAYTLCVLLGRRNAADAEVQAEYLLAQASAEEGGGRAARHGASSAEADAAPPVGGALRRPRPPAPPVSRRSA